ncbi:hypothetical protein ACFY2Z_24560 [Streptomyces sp. NPDC001222]|uniref:hypothetical protein n=1 Tax=Streptomyces sp. NPDC001222 TaxID=3364548 RepID=UPI0036C0E321
MNTSTPPYERRQCGARSPQRHDNRADADADADAEDERDGHRATVHGGLVPAAGDGIRAVHAEARGDGCLPSGSFLFFLFLLAAVLTNCWGR